MGLDFNPRPDLSHNPEFRDEEEVGEEAAATVVKREECQESKRRRQTETEVTDTLKLVQQGTEAHDNDQGMLLVHHYRRR